MSKKPLLTEVEIRHFLRPKSAHDAEVYLNSILLVKKHTDMDIKRDGRYGVQIVNDCPESSFCYCASNVSEAKEAKAKMIRRHSELKDLGEESPESKCITIIDLTE